MQILNSFYSDLGSNALTALAFALVFSILLSVVLISINFLLSIRKWDMEKLSPYECGFEPYGDARQKFDVRFYLVSLLFIIFDLEVSYLFPLFVVLHDGFVLATIFILILTIGFVYEFSRGALDAI